MGRYNRALRQEGEVGMIQLDKRSFELDENGNFIHLDLVSTLAKFASPIIQHREFLYKRYVRKEKQEIIAPFERYITNIASGYIGGKPPKFSINDEVAESIKEATVKLFNKDYGVRADSKEYMVLVDYINDYNDLPNFFYQLVRDYIITGASYGRLYENDENEIVFANMSPLQCVAVYDYSTPVQKIALLRIWKEYDENFNLKKVVEITTSDYVKVFVEGQNSEDYSEREEMSDSLHWKLAPFIALENPDETGYFEPVLTLIDAYEKALQNTKHTFEYNDNDGCKLMIVGYSPENPLMIEGTDLNGNKVMVKNPARDEEDRLILNAPTFYTDENGKVEWITKNVNDTAMENHKNTLMTDILMFAAIPDIAATRDYKLTATEVERAFFPIEQYLIELDRLLQVEFLAMWENIVDRINFKKKTNFDFRDIHIEFPRNLPSDFASQINNIVLLSNLLSKETLIRLLPYDIDVETEMSKLSAEQAENAVQESIENKIDTNDDEGIYKSGLNPYRSLSNAIGSAQRKNQYTGSSVVTKEQKTMLDEALKND